MAESKLVDIHIRKISSQVRDAIRATAFMLGVSANQLYIQVLTDYANRVSEQKNA